jgi:hypothetical protein
MKTNSPNEFRQDENRHPQEQLERLLLEGLHSGEAEQMTEQDWTEIRAEIRRAVLRLVKPQRDEKHQAFPRYASQF